MFKNMKPLPKLILIGAVVGSIGYGINKAMVGGYFNSKPVSVASVPSMGEIPTTAPVREVGTTRVETPRAESNEVIRIKTLAWNATAGLHYANGGAMTQRGSLIDQKGLKVQLLREDMYDKMTADLAAYAKDPSTGIQFAIIMGDGYPAFYKATTEALRPFGQGVEVVGSLGYSRGEDKCVIDSGADPKGSLIAAVLRDGDWNICVKYAHDNNIAINPDEKTYDPNAMNFSAVDDFTKADEKFIAGAVEERAVVSNGKLTGEKLNVKVNGTATWTPGDVKDAKERGNLKVLASTKEYMWQMPAVLIGNKNWMAAHPLVVQNLLAAAFEGGEKVRSDANALQQAGKVEAEVYGEQNGSYWAKYFKGVVEEDKTGHPVSLGGSTTSGLGDNAFLFGLNGNDNLYKKVYSVYGGLVTSYYPDLMPVLLPYEQAVNTSYIRALLGEASSVAKADTPVYDTSRRGSQFAGRSYTIEFQSGSAAFMGQSVKTLNELLDNIAVSGLTVQVNGHTDNVGDSMMNMQLSKARADAVKTFLMTNAPANFSESRVVTRGYGDSQPVVLNTTSNGRARNRRVEVLLFGN